jgi:hypothetical protein
MQDNKLADTYHILTTGRHLPNGLQQTNCISDSSVQ